MLAMDDEAVLLERHVAMAASAWRHAKAETEAYGRFVAATDEWDAYAGPQLEEPAEELLDQLADNSAPLTLDEVVAHVTAQIRKAAPADAAAASHAGSTSLGSASTRTALSSSAGTWMG